MAIPKETLWPLEPHTLGKHLVLQSYLDAWLPIMGRWNGRILFIDGFAGPGKYKGGEDGSPLIALNALKNHAARSAINAEVVFFFVEKDRARAAYLKGLVRAESRMLPSRCRVRVVPGAFDNALSQLLNMLDEQKRQLAPSFVMIDPFGVSDTPMEVIARILQNQKCEVYVSFMYEAINRFKSSHEFEGHLDRLFGAKDWRDGIGIRDPGARKDFFYGLYKKQLRAAGASNVVHFELYEGDRLVYAIFFGTQHWKGADLMKRAIWKVAPFGDFRFRGTHSSQPILGLDITDYTHLREQIKSEFRGRNWVDIEQVEEFVASDRTDYHTSQLKKPVLIPMEESGEIEIAQGTRRRKKTYPEGTRLRFR
ncbi:MAG: three-Cys-motif partner protein TcmP [Acidobacteria bacterium]|nr:three-Cys-motif partner protein TcmP [Acidobacteriota bacterium]